MSSGPVYCIRFFLLTMATSATALPPNVVCVIRKSTYIQVVLKVIACTGGEAARGVHEKVRQEPMHMDQHRVPLHGGAIHADLRWRMRELVLFHVDLLED